MTSWASSSWSGQRLRAVLVALATLSLGLAACSPGGDNASVGGGSSAGADRPRVVVSTTIWADVVRRSFGELVEVTVLIPNDADPHYFAPSAKQAGELEAADLIVVNGAGLEAGLDATIESAEGTGVPVFTIVDHVATRTVGDDHDDGDRQHDDQQDGDQQDDGYNDDGDAEHGHEGVDPHVWFDPTLVADAVKALAAQLDDGLTDGAIEASAAYLDELAALDADIADQIDGVAPDQRKLISNHDSLGYYADRYGLEVVTTLVGSLTTDAQPSVAEMAEVAEQVEASGVGAIFVETNGATDLAQAIIDETGREVEVIALNTESLGSSESYVEMMRDDTEQIVDGLMAAPAAQSSGGS